MGSGIEVPITKAPNPPERAVNRVSSAKTWWFWHLVNFSPFFLLVWFVSRFATNIPLVDEWFLASLFHAVRFKQATFIDFFAQANEHRIVFPKLVWTALAFATHWNLRVEMMLHVLLALIVFVVFYGLALQQVSYTGSGLFHLANFSVSFFLFSIVQYGLWLWAYAGGHVFVQASVALAIGATALKRLHPWARFTLAACFCLIASFSSAQGLASWLALLPCIALLRTRGRSASKFIVWGFLFLATVAVYFHGFRFLNPAPNPLDALHHPAHSIAFFLVLLGAPFCQVDAMMSVQMACLVGAVILIALTACVALLRRYEPRELIVPWLSVALFGVLFAGMATAGRSGWLPAAMQSRYVTGTIFVAIAAIQLGRLACRGRGEKIYLFLLGALCSLMLWGSINSLSVARHLKEDFSHAKLFLEVIRYVDPVTDSSSEGPFFPIYPTEGTGNIRPMAELLNDIGFLHLVSTVAFVDNVSPHCGSFESADGSGDLLHLRQDKDEITVSGWASLPGNRGLPKLVLISHGDQKTFITGAVVGLVDRTDIAALRQDSRYLHSGWRVSFPAKFLPPGKGTLKAWVYDSAEKRFIRMADSGGEKQFDVETR